MALITCPECGKEFSDSVKACIHCGFSVNKAGEPEGGAESNAPAPGSQAKRRKLTGNKRNPVTGAVMIIMGIISIGIGIPLISIIIGIFVIIGGFMLVGLGVANIQGTQKGKCPYCNNDVTVTGNDPVFKCPHCKNRCNKKESYLEQIL